MKMSISRCLDILANNRWPDTEGRLDSSDICRLGRIVCKAIHRMGEVDWYSEHGDRMAGPGDIIAALYHWGHDHSTGQYSEGYALGCLAGRIYSPGCGGIEPGSQEADMYLDWTYADAHTFMKVCTDCYQFERCSDLTWLDGCYLASEAPAVLARVEAGHEEWRGRDIETEELLDEEHSIDPCDACGCRLHGERKGWVLL